MSEHTQIPWHIAAWSPQESVILAKGEDGKDKHVTMTAIDADARFIVRAVNSHYALVEALAKVVSDCQLAIDALGNSSEEFSSAREAFRIIRDRASAALASKDTPTHG